MGMSLYEATKIMNRDSLLDSKAEVEARDIVIDAVRKYQKIVEIVAHYKENVRDKVENENMEKILEVIENGA